MSNYGDSYVWVFTGSRGSGKTLSMTLWAVLDMIMGRKVWSNYPIAFCFRHPDGRLIDYKSEELNKDALYCFDDEYFDGAVYWDEVTLSTSGRSSMSVQNRLINAVMTLIRKRHLRFYMTTQDFQWLDSQIKFQCDAWTSCMDIHYLNRNIEKGSQISQITRDMSGHFTGYQWKDSGQEYKNMFHSKFVWGSYDTDKEFDVLGEMRKVKLELGAKVIEYGDVSRATDELKLKRDRDAIPAFG